MISPNFWQSENVSKLSIPARLLLVGMISNADDYGRGRATPAFLKSICFTYDNVSIRLIKNYLKMIYANISVIEYQVNGSAYYMFTKWTDFQRVDKPQPSSIPPPVSTDSQNDSENGSQNSYGASKDSISKEKIKEVEVKTKETFRESEDSNNNVSDDKTLKEKITELFKLHCNKAPAVGEVTRIYNLVTNETRLPKENILKIVAECFSEFQCLAKEKQNTQYLAGSIKGRITDAFIKVKEAESRKNKQSQSFPAVPDWKKGSLQASFREEQAKLAGVKPIADIIGSIIPEAKRAGPS